MPYVCSIFLIFLDFRIIAYLISFPLVVGIHEEVEHKMHFCIAPNMSKYFFLRRLLGAVQNTSSLHHSFRILCLIQQ